jgi:hypothetical protein
MKNEELMEDGITVCGQAGWADVIECYQGYAAQ